MEHHVPCGVVGLLLLVASVTEPQALIKTTLQIVSKEYACSSSVFPLLSDIFMTPYRMHLKPTRRESRH